MLPSFPQGGGLLGDGVKDDLRKLYDDAHVWVYGDFTLQFPERDANFE